MPNFFRKLHDGNRVRIAYLGGSITLGEGYRPRTVRFFQERYPQTRIEQINAGLGGTGSPLGACRLVRDVLGHRPDLVFIDFAGNDCEDSTPERTLCAVEGIVRKIWEADASTDICFLYFLNRSLRKSLREGKSHWTCSVMERVADLYGIPSINAGLRIVRLEQHGRLVCRAQEDSEEERHAQAAGKIVFSHDGTHPTPRGHDLYAETIAGCMEEMEQDEAPFKHILGEPLTPLPWSDASLVPFDAATLGKDWRVVEPAAEGIQVASIDRFPQLFKAETAGASLEFRFRGRAFGLFGVFGLNSGQLLVSVDGGEAVNVPLFDQYGYCYRVHYVLLDASRDNVVHDVRMELSGERPDRSMLLPDRAIRDPERFDDGIVCYGGELLLVGDLL